MHSRRRPSGAVGFLASSTVTALLGRLLEVDFDFPENYCSVPHPPFGQPPAFLACSRTIRGDLLMNRQPESLRNQSIDGEVFALIVRKSNSDE